MAMNPTPFFSNARNFTTPNGQFTDNSQSSTEIHVNIFVPPNNTALPPLPPVKHSSTLFTGRDGYLQRLRDYFSSSIEGQRKSFLLYGLGGIGKTQTCLKSIEESSGLFSNIFWIDGSSKDSIELGLMQIGQANNASSEAKQSAGSVLEWISAGANWLIVYDGANGDYQTVEKYLPSGNEGNVLITSRNVGLKRITLDSLQVLGMAEGEAISLLMKSARLDDMSEHNSTLARKLASELGGIPIALDQAGAYMLTIQCGIAHYLELYMSHKHELMSNPDFKCASDHDRTTYGTWDMSIQNIENMAAKDGEESLAAQSAINILRHIAFLDHANISEELLFKNAVENYMNKYPEDDHPSSARCLDQQTLFSSSEGVWEKLKFLAGIQVLLSLSLIEAHSQLYSLHSLVQFWTRYRVPKAEISDLYLSHVAVGRWDEAEVPKVDAKPESNYLQNSGGFFPAAHNFAVIDCEMNEVHGNLISTNIHYSNMWPFSPMFLLVTGPNYMALDHFIYRRAISTEKPRVNGVTVFERYYWQVQNISPMVNVLLLCYLLIHKLKFVARH